MKNVYEWANVKLDQIKCECRLAEEADEIKKDSVDIKLDAMINVSV